MHGSGFYTWVLPWHEKSLKYRQISHWQNSFSYHVNYNVVHGIAWLHQLLQCDTKRKYKSSFPTLTSRCLSKYSMKKRKSWRSVAFNPSKAGIYENCIKILGSCFVQKVSVPTIHHHPAVCLTTGSKPLPKGSLFILRSTASSFKWEYPLLSLRSCSSFLRLLPCLLVTSISPFIFPSITCFRRQFLRKMWPIQLDFHFLIACRIFLCSLTWNNTSSFPTRSVQLIFSILLQHHISELFRCFLSVLGLCCRYSKSTVRELGLIGDGACGQVGPRTHKYQPEDSNQQVYEPVYVTDIL